jgi:hypothetical protein
VYLPFRSWVGFSGVCHFALVFSPSSTSRRMASETVGIGLCLALHRSTVSSISDVKPITYLTSVQPGRTPRRVLSKCEAPPVLAPGRAFLVDKVRGSIALCGYDPHKKRQPAGYLSESRPPRWPTGSACRSSISFYAANGKPQQVRSALPRARLFWREQRRRSFANSRAQLAARRQFNPPGSNPTGFFVSEDGRSAAWLSFTYAGLWRRHFWTLGSWFASYSLGSQFCQTITRASFSCFISGHRVGAIGLLFQTPTLHLFRVLVLVVPKALSLLIGLWTFPSRLQAAA